MKLHTFTQNREKIAIITEAVFKFILTLVGKSLVV